MLLMINISLSWQKQDEQWGQRASSDSTITAMSSVIIFIFIELFRIVNIFRKWQDLVCRYSVLQIWSNFSKKISSSSSMRQLISSIYLSFSSLSSGSSQLSRLIIDCFKLLIRPACISLTGLSSILWISSLISSTLSYRLCMAASLLLTLYFMSISFFQQSKALQYLLVSVQRSLDMRKASKMLRNYVYIKKSRMVLTMSWRRPVGSSMWYILFLKRGQMMLQRKQPRTLRSLSIWRMGQAVNWLQIDMTMDCSPRLAAQRMMEVRLKMHPMVSTMSSSPFMEYFWWTRVCSHRQQTMAMSHINSWMVSLMPKPSSLMRGLTLKEQLLTSMKVKKTSQSQVLLLIRTGTILRAVTRAKNMASRYQFFMNLKIQVLRLEWSIQCAQTNLRARMTQSRYRLPSKAQKTVRQVYLKSPQFLVKQLQVQARGYMTSWMAMQVIIMMHRTGDRYFIGQQSLKMNHYEPIRTHRVRISSIRPIDMQTLSLTGQVSPRQYWHPQNSIAQV